MKKIIFLFLFSSLAFFTYGQAPFSGQYGGGGGGGVEKPTGIFMTQNTTFFIFYEYDHTHTAGTSYDYNFVLQVGSRHYVNIDTNETFTDGDRIRFFLGLNGGDDRMGFRFIDANTSGDVRDMNGTAVTTQAGGETTYYINPDANAEVEVLYMNGTFWVMTSNP